MTIEELAKQIIDSNIYMSLATFADEKPWACALFMGVDENYHLYFVSNIKALHVQNVLKNPRVAVVIFDSHSIAGRANGVQLSGTCHRLTGDEVQRGIDAIYSKRYPDPSERVNRNLTPEEFSRPENDPSSRYIFEIMPEHLFVLDKESGEDSRVEIDFDKLEQGGVT